MLRLTLAAAALVASFAIGWTQQQVDGHGSTCTATNKRCYELGGDAATCEPKLKQCLQTGAYYGNRYTITNLKKR